MEWVDLVDEAPDGAASTMGSLEDLREAQAKKLDWMAENWEELGFDGRGQMYMYDDQEPLLDNDPENTELYEDTGFPDSPARAKWEAQRLRDLNGGGGGG